MTPLGAVCVGLLLVVVDIRLPGLDLAADPFGWMLVVAGTARLAAIDHRFAPVRTLSVLAGLLSLFDVVRPSRTVSTPTGTSTAAVAPEGALGLVVFAYDLVTLTVTVALCLAVRTRARDHGDDRLSRRFGLLALLQGLTGAAVVAAALAVLLGAPREPESDAVRGAVVVVVVAALAVGAWLVVTLAQARHLPWLQDRTPAEGTERAGA